ncbi:MAG TPA: isoprenylcysteine carboxylmethyltransferase family protein [Planctomycetota bacterium]|nr:isoprenylcysteine carboxylmethyltransferase family protein [Planctomycetota bacterium]
MMHRSIRVGAALSMALLCHGAFLLAVGSMACALATGLQLGQGTLPGGLGVAADLLLVLQFPFVHSFLLSAPGRRWLVRLSPVGHGRTLAPSTYVWIGSLQLLLTFWVWTPSGVVWHRPHGAFGVAQYAMFAAAWLFLVKALADAGLGGQSGAIGWWALLRDREVVYGDLPTRGLFAWCRQPIYLGFALVLGTAPVWSADWLLLAASWTVYCVLGPRRKESRWQGMFGDRFRAYRSSVPYLLPRFRR